mgnify:CR=1 FL=1
MNREIQKLKHKIEYLRLELEEVRETNAKCLSKFNTDFANILSEVNEVKSESKNSKKEPNTEEIIKEEVDDTTKKLFKDIAVKTHPDKNFTETDELFVKANEAKAKNDLSTLISIAEILKIDVSEYLNDPMLLEQHAKEINQEIEQIKSQLAWIWYHVKDEDRKPLSDIIKSHIKGTSK